MNQISWAYMNDGFFTLVILLLLLTVYCGKTIFDRDLRNNPNKFLRGQFNHLIGFFCLGLSVVWAVHVFTLLGVK